MAAPKDFIALAGSERPPARGASLIGPLDPNSLLQLTFVVRQRPGSEPLPSLDYWQRTPLRERKYLSVEEYAQKYGADPAELDRVAKHATAFGIMVLDTNVARRAVVVSGTAAQVNAALGITLNQYAAPVPPPPQPRRKLIGAGEADAQPTNVYRSFEGPVHLPMELASVVEAVFGLDNRQVGGINNGDPTNTTTTTVPNVAQLYNFPTTGAAGQTIGIFSGGGNYSPNDVTNYFASLPAGYRTAPTVVDVNLTVNGTTYSNDPSSVGSNLGDYEIGQDIQIAATVAQGATVAVYFTEDTEDGWLAFLQRAIFPNAGDPTPSVLSSSWYLTGEDNSLGSSVLNTLSVAFASAATRGITIFIALGDSGSDDGVGDGSIHVQYCGSDPWVTSCGGTVVGNVQTGPPVTFDQWVWNDVSTGNGATAGAVSAYFAAPAYQTAAGITGATDNNGHFHAGRAVPDVAGNGSPVSGYNNILIGGSSFTGNGTSAVAPLFAGLFAVINAAFDQPMGFLNPVIYSLGESLFSDIVQGNNDPGDGAPYFTAAAGWDCCTGWGSFDGNKLINGIAAMLYTQTLYFLMGKNSYGLDEVAVHANYPTAFWLVLEGFTPTAAAGLTPMLAGTFTLESGVTVTVGAPQPELPTYVNTPQRILFPCTVDFAPAAIASLSSGGIFPNPGAAPATYSLTCSLTVSGTPLNAETEIILLAGADPYFVNINPQENNVFYLSQDLRVFTAVPGITTTPIPGVGTPPQLAPPNTTVRDTSAGYQYIQDLLTYLNANYSDPSGTDPFTLFPDQGSGDSSVTPVTIDPSSPSATPWVNYNYAVARVRLTGAPNTTTSSNVRVFFRLFATETSDTDYIPSWTYPSSPDAAGLPGAPELGVGNVTIPFFATGNYEANGDFGLNVDYSANSANNAPIQIGGSGSVWSYYGCFLNVYPPANTIGGTTVLSMFPSTHSCIVAEIAFDDAPIPTTGPVTEGPENSDKLAQRNLQITLSDNPGPPATHRIPQTFDSRPSASLSSSPGGLLDYPDELMIDWGNTPRGSAASIYWPQTTAAEVLSLADTLYSAHELSAADPNTLHCKAHDGFTFVPIPPGTGAGFAGLLTVDLPPSVVRGQEFLITVRRLSTRRLREEQPGQFIATTQEFTAQNGSTMRNWRYVTGTFGIRIPVSTRHIMLPLEEQTLAIMKWRLEQLAPSDRWYPVLQRYIAYIAGRVAGLGGNPGAIKPSPGGVVPYPVVGGEEPCEHTGKIVAIFYDRFGDFDGFKLLTFEGIELCFRSWEAEVEELVRFAWQERCVISVFTERHAPHCPISFVLR